LAQVVVLKIYRAGQLVDEKRLNQDHIVIGSSESESHVTLSRHVSPIHASIEKRGDKYVVCDLGSEKGTYKNADKILEAEIRPGDKIVTGDFTIEFWLAEVQQEVTTATSIVDESTQEISIEEVKTTEPAAINASSSTPSVDQAAKIAVAGTAIVGSGQSVSRNTFAPSSPYKNVNEFIRPTKGTSVEILVAWRERVIASHHFSEKGAIWVGTHPSCDVIVPLLTSNVNKVQLVHISNQAQIMLYPGMEGVLVGDKHTTPFSQLANIGRGSGQSVALQQGEMARITIGPDVEVIVRYSSQAPKPVIIPFLDLSSNGFLAVLLAIVLSGILSLWVALNKLDKLDRPDDEEYRTALILTNPPPPPPKPKVKLPPPPKEPPKKKVKKIVKLVEKKPPPPKKKATLDMSKTRKRVTKQKTATAKPGQNARARGSGNDASPRAMKPKDGKKTNQVTSVKQGGSVKTAKKEGAQMQSERNLKKSGIFSAFGTSGRNDKLDTSYSGSGELAGLADQASGSAGFDEDRPGSGLGSKFKDTGAGGQGKSNVGVSGLTKGGKGLGAGGFGDGGLGDRKAVSIIPGGSGEEFSGQIDREGIRKVFFDNQRAIRSCYERELNKNPNLSGVLKLNFDIGELGRVVGQPSVNWGDSSMKSRSVASCILNRLKTWRFPEPPRNQVVNVIYPLAFAAK
jgi:pSer/pThr/pTyr-binding forkhead associated (FHA) protein